MRRQIAIKTSQFGDLYCQAYVRSQPCTLLYTGLLSCAPSSNLIQIVRFQTYLFLFFAAFNTIFQTKYFTKNFSKNSAIIDAFWT